MTSVYIHIPFCERICTYCDFPKRVGTPEQFLTYLDALEREIELYGELPPLDTLYIGGGTPSILAGVTLDRLAVIVQRFKWNENHEFTIECNPEHITPDRLEVYRRLGVNRISLGVQTFHNRLLKRLNRKHDRHTVFRAIELLKAYGFDNISIDLMFALPFQHLEDLYEDLSLVLSLDVPHLSAYSLILEDKTVLAYQVKKKQVILPGDDAEAVMYQIVMDTLKGAGYRHYEISNFARRGYESRHNQVYWKNGRYYGFGMGASGYIGDTRYDNEDQLLPYLTKVKKGERPIRRKEVLSCEEQLKETLLLGLRLLDGVALDEVNRDFGVQVESIFHDELMDLQRKGWIRLDSHLRLSEQGLFYGNEVFSRFI